MNRIIGKLACLVMFAMASTQVMAQTASQPFKLLFIGGLSGPVGPIGKQELAGYKAAVDDVNSRGGILGRRIELTTEDSGGQGAKAVSILQEKLNAGQQPDAVIPGAISNETLALLPVLTQRKIISTAMTASNVANNPKLYPYMFLATVNFNYFSNFLGNYFKSKGYKKIAVLTPNDALGQSVARTHKEWFEKAGLTLVLETFSGSDLDLTAPLQRVAESRPDAMVFSVLLPTSAPLVLEARHKVGLNVPTFADVNTTADLATLVAPEKQKNVFLAHMKVQTYQAPEKRSPLLNNFMEEVKKTGVPQGAMYTAALAWDCIQAMALAYNQAGTTDPDKVKAAFENLRLPAEKDKRFLAFKSVRFSPTDHFNTEENADDFTVIPLGPKVDGVFKPGS